MVRGSAATSYHHAQCRWRHDEIVRGGGRVGTKNSKVHPEVNRRALPGLVDVALMPARIQDGAGVALAGHS